MYEIWVQINALHIFIIGICSHNSIMGYSQSLSLSGIGCAFGLNIGSNSASSSS